MIEKDPNGKTPSDPGSKLDAGKNRLGLVIDGFARALWAVGEVGTYGAMKYTDNGWQLVEGGIERYRDADYRHKLRQAMGEGYDPETELLHAAHAAWNALAHLDLLIRESEKNSAGGVVYKKPEGTPSKLTMPGDLQWTEEHF